MITPRRLLALVAAGCLAAGLAGCARSTVAINAAQADKKAEPAKDTPKPAASGEPFRFPDDHGGKLLGQLLQPPAQMPGEGKPVQLTLPPPPDIDQPAVPLAVVSASPARPGLTPKPSAPRPHSPSEEQPLSAYKGEPAGPVRLTFQPGAPVRLSSRDVNEPVPLPTLASPGADRVSLEDPTVDESLKAALAEKPPVRATPAPFDPRSVPDPFENAQTVRLKAPPAEDHTPSGGTPQQPPKP